MTKRKTVGLALGSGAARGLAHIGVIRAFERHGIPIDFIAGTSVGALIGAHYALFKDIERTRSYTNKKEREEIGLKVLLAEVTLSGGLVKGAKYEQKLDEIFGGKSFADTQIPFRAIATDLVSGEQVVFSEGSLARATHASSAVPGFFKPVVSGERVLVDGGLVNPVPDDVVKALGADIVVAVNLDFFGDPNASPLDQKQLGFRSIMLRSVDIMRHALAHHAIRNADFTIEPPLAQYSGFDFFIKDFVDEVIEIGEREAEHLIPHIQERLAIE